MSEWSIWQDIECIQELADQYQWPGVYRIRLADSTGAIRIGRFFGPDPDKDGLLYIGEGDNVAGRIVDFNEASNGRASYKHPAGEKLFLLRFQAGFGERVYDNCKMQFSAVDMRNKTEAKRRESEELKRYFVEYGELPPLNSNLGDMAGGWD
jgi:hypothetical protein